MVPLPTLRRGQAVEFDRMFWVYAIEISVLAALFILIWLWIKIVEKPNKW